MTSTEIITTAAAIVAGPAGAFFMKLWNDYQKRKERIERARINASKEVQQSQVALNGKTTPTLIEMLEETLSENRALRREVDAMRDELNRNTLATLDLAEEASPTIRAKAKRHLSDPQGLPIQRERRDDTGRQKAQPQPHVHREDIHTERPIPRRRFRREEE